MPSEFVHLHLHTHYSMLDGACTASGIVKLAKEMGMPGAAITDHGYLGGAEEFHRVLSGEGLNPIVGCEAYVSPTTRFDRDPTREFIKGFHLVLLCENNTGYHNLCKLVSESYRNGLYYKPRIDKELLSQYNEGLIALSACIAGEIPRMLLRGSQLSTEPEPGSVVSGSSAGEGMFAGSTPVQVTAVQSASGVAAAEKALGEYLDIFGRERFFIEIMDHGIPEERAANTALIKLAKKYDLGIVATNDVHYQRREDAAAHEVMLCIQTGSLLSDEKRFRFPTQEFYFKSRDEMAELFGEVPESLSNTVAIAERCSISFDYKTNHYPKFFMEDGEEPDASDLRKICLSNLKYRYNIDPAELDLPEHRVLRERMDYELGIIERTGFCSYFMVVSDFIRYAKEQGVPVGPGRGSGAGSLVAYLTLITDIDPLRYNLLFERFLNPERVSPPDFDIDFCERRRGEVIEYVRRKYGFDNVAQICTYGQLKAKAVVKDVARVLGFDFDAGNRLTKLIPDELKMTIDKAINQSSELSKLIEEDAQVAKVFEYARILEGLNRQAGVHAAGVIIGDQQLDNLVPLSRSAQGDMVVQYPKEPCENLGLLKMDFLGLRTLTIIRNALDMIKEQHGIDIDPAKIPLDDAKTFDMLQRGDTVAVFQLESGGMQNLCRNFGVETVEHIIALVALYRPGPMQFMDDFIKRKKGEVPIEYDHPLMEEFLSETYGIMLYQEQIMQVVQALAGFSLGGADILRRAIGKKKEHVMIEQREKFIEGCAKTNNISTELASRIWEKIKLFAGYGFNKSHSAAYGIVSYQTAWLKANYPVEFMAAVLTSEIENAEKIAMLLGTCKEMKIEVLPPDVNSSGISFSVDAGRIRFGLGAIKGFGESAAGAIISSRSREGKFSSFLDFCERCGSSLNSRMIECLARSGALDSLGLRRSQLLAIAEPMMRYAADRARDKAIGQGSFFDLDDGFGGDDGAVPVPDVPEFAWEEILKSEKELLGFYVSGHPLEPLRPLVKNYATPVHALGELEDGAAVRIAGMVAAFETKFSKNSGKPFGVIHIEDLDAGCECMVYERALNAMNESGIQLVPGFALLVEATVSRRDESEKPRLIAERIYQLEAAPERYTDEIYLHIYETEVSREKLPKLAELCLRHPGKSKLMLCVVKPDDSVVYLECRKEKIRVTAALLHELDEILGKDRYRIRQTEVTAPRRFYPAGARN